MSMNKPTSKEIIFANIILILVAVGSAGVSNDPYLAYAIIAAIVWHK